MGRRRSSVDEPYISPSAVRKNSIAIVNLRDGPSDKFTEIDMAEQNVIKSVQLEGLVVTKIVRHCSTTFPTIATGFIVGMERNGVLEVTNSYPYPAIDVPFSDNHHDINNASTLAALAPRAKPSVNYQAEMIKCLREVNTDANGVGYFQSSNMGNFVNLSMIENQHFFQKELNERTIALIHDVSKSSQGSCSIRAFRLSPNFMVAFKENKFSTETLQKSGLSYKDILIELPVTVHNSHLATQYLHQLQSMSNTIDDKELPTSLAELMRNPTVQQQPLYPNFDSLDLSVDPFIEKTADLLLDSIENHHTENNNYQFYQRQLGREQNKIKEWQQKRKSENAARAASKQPLLPEDEWQRLFKLPTEPSRLETLLNSAQIDVYAKGLDNNLATVSAKMFAVKNNLVPEDK